MPYESCRLPCQGVALLVKCGTCDVADWPTVSGHVASVRLAHGASEISLSHSPIICGGALGQTCPLFAKRHCVAMVLLTAHYRCGAEIKMVQSHIWRGKSGTILSLGIKHAGFRTTWILNRFNLTYKLLEFLLLCNSSHTYFCNSSTV